MAYKFNPFTGTLDFYEKVKTIGELLKAKKPLKLTGEEIEIEKEGIGTEQLAANSVTEAKVAFLSEIVKTGSPEQTITTKKLFETSQPAEASVGSGTNAAPPIKVQGGVGGNTNIATTGKGGVGAAMTIILGEGGQAGSAKTSTTGGEGGTYEVKSGSGATAIVAGAAKAFGGIGGKFKLRSGDGGGAEEGTESTGGVAGQFLMEGGNGGAAITAVTTNVGGEGSPMIFKAGAGGNASGASGSNTGGQGGKVEILAGKAGTGGTPLGGKVIIASGAGTAAAQNGAIEIKTGVTTRVTIAAEGLMTAKSGLTVENAFKATEPVNSLVAPIEIASTATYEVPSNIQGLWKENISVQGTLNIQGRFDEDGLVESSPWILPAPVAPTNNIVIPANSQTWFKLNTSIEGLVNLQGQLVEVE